MEAVSVSSSDDKEDEETTTANRDLPCVVCLKLFNQDKTLEVQAGLTSSTCAKLFRLFYSEVVDIRGIKQPQPVYDFTRECLPFCDLCRAIMIKGLKLGEHIRKAHDILLATMSRIRHKVAESPDENQGSENQDLWANHKLGLLRCQVTRSCKEQALNDVDAEKFSDGIAQDLDSIIEERPIQKGTYKVMVARTRTSPLATATEFEGAELTVPQCLIQSSSNETDNVGNEGFTNNVSSTVEENAAEYSCAPETYSDFCSSPSSCSQNSSLPSSRSTSASTSSDEDEAPTRNSVSPSNSSSLTLITTSDGFINDHEYMSRSSDEDGNMIRSTDVETVLEESETELVLLSPTKIKTEPEFMIRPLLPKKRSARAGPLRRVQKAVKMKYTVSNRYRGTSKLKPNVCAQCGKSFKTNAGLNGHMWVHNKPYCGLCRLYFENQKGMDDHNLKYHSVKDDYSCRFCGKHYTSRDALLHHLRQHNSEETYSCTDGDCGKAFKTRQELKDHIAIAHSRGAFAYQANPMINFSNRNTTDYDDEIVDDDDEYGDITFEVDEEEESEISYANYPHVTFSTEDDDDMEEEYPSLTVTCGLAAEEPEPITEFSQGQNSFRVQQDSTDFEMPHGSIRKGQSTIMPISSASQLANPPGPTRPNYHTITVTRLPPAPTYQCDICGKKVSSKLQLRCHKRNHPVRSISCPICNRSFNRADNLKVHMKSHNEIKNNHGQVKCNVCNRIYASPKHLAAHACQTPQWKDPPVQNYKCSLCGRMFSGAKAFQAHSKLHAKAKFRCFYCGAGFSYASNRRRHIVQFHPEVLNRQTKT